MLKSKSSPSDAQKTGGVSDYKDNKRFEKALKVADLGVLMEGEGAYKRAIDLYFKNGMENSARKCADELYNKKDSRSLSKYDLYAAAYTYAKLGEFERAQELVDKFSDLGPDGLYMAASVAIEAGFAKNAEMIAANLSGKGIVFDEKPNRTFFRVTDQDSLKAMVKGMTSLIFWNMVSESEKMYFALRIYQKLGKIDEVDRCLENLENLRAGKPEEYHIYGLLLTKGAKATRAEGYDYLQVVYCELLEEGKIDELISVAEKANSDVYERYSSYNVIMHGLIYEEKLTDEAFVRISMKKDKIKKEIAEKEREKLGKIVELLATKNFENIEKASSLVSKVKFEFLSEERVRSGFFTEECEGYRLKCADAAFELKDNVKAQIFAGAAYTSSNRPLEKALTCAHRLLELGELNAGKRLYESISYHYRFESEKINEIADGLRHDYPMVSLSLYVNADNKQAAFEITEKILENGTFEEVEWAAWAVSRLDKHSLLMLEALDKLESFGEKGQKSAKGICAEMQIFTQPAGEA